MAPARSPFVILVAAGAQREGRGLRVRLLAVQALGLRQRRGGGGVALLLQHLPQAHVRLRRSGLAADGLAEPGDGVVEPALLLQDRGPHVVGLGVVGLLRDRVVEGPQRLLGAFPSATSTTPSVKWGSGSDASSAMALRSSASASANSSFCFRAMPRL